MNRIALVALDLDGTLFNSSGDISPVNAAAIRRCRENGIRVVIATTRGKHTVTNLYEQLELCEPMICSNGALILSAPDGEMWANYTLPLEIARTIAAFADEHQWELSTVVEDVTYWRQRPDQSPGPLDAHRIIVKTNLDALVGAPSRLLSHDPAAIQAIKSLCETQFAGLCHLEPFYKADGSPHSLVIFGPEVNKGNGLRLVCEKLEIDLKRVMAVGDHYNDLSMFAIVGTSVAMGNAPETVKQAATHVAPAHDENGVAWALENLCYTSS